MDDFDFSVDLDIKLHWMLPPKDTAEKIRREALQRKIILEAARIAAALDHITSFLATEKEAEI